MWTSATGGSHGQRSDAQQQGEEEAKGRLEQETEGRPRSRRPEQTQFRTGRKKRAPSCMIPKKACPGLDPGWEPVSRLREASAPYLWGDASAGEGRSEK